MEEIQYTVSGGMTHFIPEDDDPSAFNHYYESSDKALYTSKESGRNQVFVNRLADGKGGSVEEISS